MSKRWEYTRKRQAAMRKAQLRHKRLVELGKRAWARGER